MPRIALAVLLATISSACVASKIPYSAPLRTVNQHPAQLTALHASPREARAPAAGKVQADVRMDWTSHWMRPGTGSDEIVMDGETFRTQFDFRVGLGEHLDLEVGIPFMYAGGGYLDSLINEFHQIFGLPENNRNDYPISGFDVGARRRQADDSLVDAYRLDSGGLRIGDVPIFLSWFPYEKDGLTLGLRGGVELPTGDEKDGYGNGGLDVNLGFLSGYDAEGYSLFFWGSHTFVAEADRAKDAGLDTRDVTQLGVGGQLALDEDFSFLLQLEFETSVLANLDETHADKNQLLIWGGFRYHVSETLDIEVGLSEELILDVSPDVSFHGGFVFRF